MHNNRPGKRKKQIWESLNYMKIRGLQDPYKGLKIKIKIKTRIRLNKEIFSRLNP